MKKGTKIALGVTIPIIGIPIVALMILIIIYGSMFLMSYIERMGETELDVIEENWKIEFPEEAKITYHYSTRGGFTGDGCSYTVCNFDNKPEAFLEDFSQDNYDKFISRYNRTINSLSEDGMPSDNIVIPQEDFIWKILDNSYDSLCLAYCNDTNTLYIVEFLL